VGVGFTICFQSKGGGRGGVANKIVKVGVVGYVYFFCKKSGGRGFANKLEKVEVGGLAINTESEGKVGRNAGKVGVGGVQKKTSYIFEWNSP
jgi:hypothetical protein